MVSNSMSGKAASGMSVILNKEFFARMTKESQIGVKIGV